MGVSVLINHSSLPISIKSSVITAKSHSARQSATVGHTKVRRDLPAAAPLSARAATIRSLQAAKSFISHHEHLREGELPPVSGNEFISDTARWLARKVSFKTTPIDTSHTIPPLLSVLLCLSFDVIDVAWSEVETFSFSFLRLNSIYHFYVGFMISPLRAMKKRRNVAWDKLSSISSSHHLHSTPSFPFINSVYGMKKCVSASTWGGMRSVRKFSRAEVIAKRIFQCKTFYWICGKGRRRRLHEKHYSTSERLHRRGSTLFRGTNRFRLSKLWNVKLFISGADLEICSQPQAGFLGLLIQCFETWWTSLCWRAAQLKALWNI